MRRFVCNQACSRLVCTPLLVQQRCLRQGGSRDVLHATVVEVVDTCLRVLRMRVTHACQFREVREDLIRLFESGQQLALQIARAYEPQRRRAIGTGGLRELSCHQCRQVRRMRIRRAPALKDGACGFNALDAFTCRNDGPTGGSSHQQLMCRTLERLVQAREPATRFITLALGPRLRGLPLARCGPMQARARHPTVAHAHLRPLVALQRLRQLHAQAIAFVRVSQHTLALIAHLAHLQALEIELHLLQPILCGPQAHAALAFQAALGRIEGQLDAVVLDIKRRSARHDLPRRSEGRRRGTGCGEEHDTKKEGLHRRRS